MGVAKRMSAGARSVAKSVVMSYFTGAVTAMISYLIAKAGGWPRIAKDVLTISLWVLLPIGGLLLVGWAAVAAADHFDRKKSDWSGAAGLAIYMGGFGLIWVFVYYFVLHG
jgi:cation transporter-like permease